MTTKWDEINTLWTQYFKLTVYKNEHLIKPLLHFWLGVYFTKNYKLLLSGQYKTFRIHPFIISPSGTGKSVAMKNCFFLLKSMGFNILYITKTTDASLIGSIDIIKNKIINCLLFYSFLS